MSRADPALPSAALRRAIADRARAPLADLRPDVAGATLEVLGDLGLALARIPEAAWDAPLDVQAKRVFAQGSGRLGLEVTTALEIGRDRGYLHAGADGRLAPAEPELLFWLAARRTVETEDAPGLMDQRLRGDLAEVSAIAAAEAETPEAQAGLVRLLAEREGPWEDLLGLSSLLAATAVGWGAECEDEVLGDLVQKAFEWTLPGGPVSHHRGATALLVAAVRGGTFAAEAREVLDERLDDVCGHLSDPDLAAHPDLLLSVDATLAPLVAVAGTDLRALASLMERCGAHGSRVAHAVARVHPPGDARDALVVGAAREALGLGLMDALSALGAVARPRGDALGLVHEALTAAREEPESEASILRGLGATEAIRQWPHLSELAGHLLGRLVVAPVHPDLRLAAAGALAAHPPVLDPIRATLLDTLEPGFGEPDPDARAGCVGAALTLGSAEPEAAMMIVALVADGAPAPLLAPHLAHAMADRPQLAAALPEVWERFPDEPIRAAALDVLEVVAEEVHGGLSLPEAARNPLLKLVLPLAGDPDADPADAGRAAFVAAWLERGDRGVHKTLRALRDRLGKPAAETPSDVLSRIGFLDLALGAAGVADEETVLLLGDDAAHAPPDVAATAATALRLLLECRDDTLPLDPLTHVLRARADLEGPQQGPMRYLLEALATLPLEPG